MGIGRVNCWICTADGETGAERGTTGERDWDGFNVETTTTISLDCSGTGRILLRLLLLTRRSRVREPCPQQTSFHRLRESRLEATLTCLWPLP